MTVLGFSLLAKELVCGPFPDKQTLLEQPDRDFFHFGLQKLIGGYPGGFYENSFGSKNFVIAGFRGEYAEWLKSRRRMNFEFVIILPTGRRFKGWRF